MRAAAELGLTLAQERRFDEARTALRCTFGPDADAPLLDAAADAIVDAVRTVTALR